MILSTYVFRVFPALSLVATRGIWWFSFLGFSFDCYFYHQICLSGSEGQCDSSWTVLYVGIAVAALTYPLVGIMRLPYATLKVFSFVLTFYLYPLIYLGDLKTPLPLALLGRGRNLLCSLFSLLLASLVRVGERGLPSALIVMILASQSFFFFVLSSPT